VYVIIEGRNIDEQIPDFDENLTGLMGKEIAYRRRI
jgi:hypothetical protein